MTIHIDVGVESTPTLQLAKALREVPGGSPPARDKWGTTMVIRPRRTDAPNEVTKDAWYDALWAIRAVCPHKGHAGTVYEHCVEYIGMGGIEPGVRWHHYVWLTIAPIGPLEAPPERPLEERLAEAPPVTTDHLTDEEVRCYYETRENALERLQQRRRLAIEQDRSAARYDWHAYARRIVTLYESLKPPKLTEGQRVISAAHRYQRALDEVENARTSGIALMHNAEKANKAQNTRKHGTKTAWAEQYGTSRPTLDAWLTGGLDEALVQVRAEELTPEMRDAFREKAREKRDEGDEGLARVYQNIADNGWPSLEDAVPWEEIRDRRYAEFDAAWEAAQNSSEPDES